MKFGSIQMRLHGDIIEFLISSDLVGKDDLSYNNAIRRGLGMPVPLPQVKEVKVKPPKDKFKLAHLEVGEEEFFKIVHWKKKKNYLDHIDKNIGEQWPDGERQFVRREHPQGFTIKRIK